MHFGETLRQSIYAPWSAHYIDYSKLKYLLRETDDASPSSATSGQELREWTEDDDSAFVHELINVQLEKVHKFQQDMNKELHTRTKGCEERLQKIVDHEPKEAKKEEEEVEEGNKKVRKGSKKGEAGEEDKKEVEEVLKVLEGITRDVEELEKYSRINFTGFLKAAKKHDRRARGKVQGKAKQSPKVTPLLQVRLSQLEFNKEDYSPLLYRLSTMYDFVRQKMGKDEGVPTAKGDGGRDTIHKFWVHPDNILEVKTFLLRRLPVLVYNAQPAKEVESTGVDPTITSLYLDNENFSLYSDKVKKPGEAVSMRLRWYGNLSDSGEVWLERKTTRGDGKDEGAVEERISLKKKYVLDFISGEYSMEKTVQKMKERNPDDTANVEKYQALVKSMQQFIKENELQPALRASYTRTAFQIPGDKRIRVSLDTDLALIREDALDTERPCRDPENWHRDDIDNAKMEYPFPALRKGEISRFPYALLELKVREQGLHPRPKAWLEELMSSHLVHPAPRFSKFLHGVAVLFDDYVNTFPFWLSDLEKDIRQDPREAWQAELERKKQQELDQTAVGSFRKSIITFGGRESPPSGSPLASAPARFPIASPQGPGATPDIQILPAEDDDDASSSEGRPAKKPLTNLRQLFPSFSTSRYGRAHSRRPLAELPPGIRKPENLLMHAGPVRVESKVWLANQRTFVKWMHITVLLASLSLAIFNAAPDHNNIAKGIAMAYTGVALFAGVWGWGIYMWRSNLIRERSGKEFDAVFGPIVVCIALAIALIINFVYKYRAVVNASKPEEPVEDLIALAEPVLRIIAQGEL